MARLTAREFEQHVAETMQLCRQEAKPFEDSGLDARKRRFKKASKDLLAFIATYLPHYAYEGFAPLHREMADACNVEEKPVLICSAGGFGKTSVVTIGCALQSILFKRNPFVVIGGMTEDLAAQNTAMIKLELEENERIVQDFGPQKGSYRWEDGDFVTAGGVRVKSRGAGQAFRGLRWRQHRPSLVILDDIEDDELAVSTRRVQKVLTWVLATVLPRLEARGWRLLLAGNVINRTGVVGSLLFHPDYKDWVRKLFPAEDAKGKPTWPERFPKDVLAKVKKILGFVRYQREMLCNPVDDSHYFQPEHTHWFPFSKLRDLSDVVCYIDPSVLASRRADYKAVICTGRAVEDPRDYVCGAWVRHATVDAMIGEYYHIWESLRPRVFVLEGNGFQQHLKRDFDRWAKVKGFQLPLAMVTATESKEVRIERLEAPHDCGDLLFCNDVGDTPLLLQQMYMWEPRGHEHDDGPDALAGSVEFRKGRQKKARFRAA
jgi:predicted phage terminase large subunit-like protein